MKYAPFECVVIDEPGLEETAFILASPSPGFHPFVLTKDALDPQIVHVDLHPEGRGREHAVAIKVEPEVPL